VEIIGMVFSLETDEILEINYSLLSFPERIISTKIAVCGARVFCGFIHSTITWNIKTMKLEVETQMNNSFCEFFQLKNHVICFKNQLVQLWDDKGSLVKNFVHNSRTGLTGVHEYLGNFVGFYCDYNRLNFFNAVSFELVSNINLGDTNASCVSFNAYVVAVGSFNASVHVFDWKTGQKKYLLLLGSTNPKTVPKSFVFHPSNQGCSEVVIDNDRIIASIGNLIRVYHFDFE
jgi:uncharacterized membrane protein YciS (DUF1049 family)